MRVRDGAEQVADETVEFRICDEVSRLLVAQRSAENTREAQQSGIAAGQAIGSAVGADQFALNTKRGRLKGNEMNVLESSAVNRLAKHDRLPRQPRERSR